LNHTVMYDLRDGVFVICTYILELQISRHLRCYSCGASLQRTPRTLAFQSSGRLAADDFSAIPAMQD
ncbi:MAG: hypothetical protein K0R55_4045, partial [Sporomusa sp.]|nr:hypothetical protein [Sporomusa sp.]